MSDDHATKLLQNCVGFTLKDDARLFGVEQVAIKHVRRQITTKHLRIQTLGTLCGATQYSRRFSNTTVNKSRPCGRFYKCARHFLRINKYKLDMHSRRITDHVRPCHPISVDEASKVGSALPLNLKGVDYVTVTSYPGNPASTPLEAF